MGSLLELLQNIGVLWPQNFVTHQNLRNNSF